MNEWLLFILKDLHLHSFPQSAEIEKKKERKKEMTLINLEGKQLLLKMTASRTDDVCSSVLECLPSKFEALDSTPSTTKK